MKKDKKIHEIITQEKGPDDWRSFAIVTDSRGWKWELRGKLIMNFTEKQKNTIKYLIDTGASRWYILDSIKDEEYYEEEYLLFKDMTDEELNDGITKMVEEGILTEGCKENKRDYGNIVVTEWKPNTASDIRRENEEAKRDPDKYDRARKLEEVKIEAKKLFKMQIEKEMEDRREKRRQWLEENT